MLGKKKAISKINTKTTIKQRKGGGILIFLASFFLYSLASPGNIPGDSELRWSVARQMVRLRGICVEDSMKMRSGTVTFEDRHYALCSPGQSICMLPFSGTGLALEKVCKLDSNNSDLVAQFLTSLILFPAIGASLVLIFYRLVLSLGYTKKTAIFSSSFLAFATMNFHYSANTQEQTQVSLLLVLAVLLMIKYHYQRRFVYAWFFCVVLGICLLFRMTSVVMIFPLYIIAAMADVFGSFKKNLPKTIKRWLFAGVLGTGVFIGFCAWYNYFRFGSIFENGYGLVANTILGGHKLFESSPLPTLAAMLFSPGKSIFLYNPVLLLLPFCFYSFYLKHKLVTVATSCALIANFIFYSFYTPWAGDYAWSIRYQVPVLPFFVLPLVELFSRPIKKPAKTVIILAVAFSVVIQLASVVYNFNLEFVQNPNHHLIPGDYVWDWSQSHLLKRFENIFRHISGKRDLSSVKVTDEEPLLLKFNHSEDAVRNAYHVNFFPFKAKNRQPTEKLFYPLLCIWFALLAGFLVSMFKLTRFYIRQT